VLDSRAAGARRFAGKVCIVTGAGQGIGRATAKRLGAEGGSIVVVDHIEDTARETVAILSEAGVDARAVIADLTRYAACETLMGEVVAESGRIDVLINVVGGTIWWQPYDLYSEEQIELELQRSLYSALWCCRAALPHMISAKSGAIVNLSSQIVEGGLYRTPYAVSKGGVEALTRSLAVENARHNIRINAVAPGSTAIADRVTSRLLIRPGESAEAAQNAESYLTEARQFDQTIMGRQGTPAEQAAAIAFLASDDASFITGQILACTGGV